MLDKACCSQKKTYFCTHNSVPIDVRLLVRWYGQPPLYITNYQYDINFKFLLRPDRNNYTIFVRYLKWMIMTRYSILLALALLFMGSCKNRQEVPPIASADISIPEVTPPVPIQKSPLAIYLDSLGLVNISDIDSTILVRLMYATADNFTGKRLYNGLREAYLNREAAEAVSEAQNILKKQHPAYRLVIYDAARPLSVQQEMWDVVKGTCKYKYVSNPAHGGGLHNYGVAVDISITDSLGTPLPMGTEVDHLGVEAHITNESQLVEEGMITPEERKNRLLLRRVMTEAGFHVLPSEWWHFNLCSRDEAKQKYQLIK